MELRDAAGNTVQIKNIELDMEAGETTFVAVRSGCSGLVAMNIY